MDNSEQILELLRQISSDLGYLVSTMPDLNKIESLLEKILAELKKR